MHHVHISTSFMLVFVMLIVGVVWAIAWAVTRRDRYAAERVYRPVEYDTARRSTPPAGYVASAPVAAPVYHSSGSSDLLTGVLIGEALSSHHTTTVIHDTSPVYVDSSPAYVDSGFTYDSGGRYSDSSGGFDASF